MGRERRLRWGPRNIDIDLLYCGDETRDEPGLTLPHPELLNRAFVLVPLAELRPRLIVNGVSIATALARLDSGDVLRVG
jgi:2-amino-4-hydroxy-6-hydroxymethyldihydropteridine diphosphokinase